MRHRQNSLSWPAEKTIVFLLFGAVSLCLRSSVFMKMEEQICIRKRKGREERTRGTDKRKRKREEQERKNWGKRKKEERQGIREEYERKSKDRGRKEEGKRKENPYPFMEFSPSKGHGQYPILFVDFVEISGQGIHLKRKYTHTYYIYT